MPHVALLSNGKYHVMLTAEGTGQSRWDGLAVTRWQDDSARDRSGTFLFLRDDDGAVWSATPQPVPASDADDDADADPQTRATFRRREHDIATELQVAVCGDADMELRRLRITNRSSRQRRLTVTSHAEIVLSPAATDSAHPAFSKLFIETEFDAQLGAVLAMRRPSTPQDKRAWLFHQVAMQASAPALSFDTDRMRFIGRGRDISRPQAMLHGEPLGGSAGAVLDAIAAIRVPLVLDAGASCTIDFFTGVAATRDAVVALANRTRAVGAGDAVLAGAGAFRDATLARIGASAADGALYEQLAGPVLYASPALRADPAEIARNTRGQSGLWGFGISGDVPVLLLLLPAAPQLDLARQMVKAHAFWKAHGIATELMIVTGSGQGADAALLEQVQRSLADGPAADSIGKAGGVFVHDAATLDDGDRTLLHSVARIVIVGGAGSLREQLERGEARSATVSASEPRAGLGPASTSASVTLDTGAPPPPSLDTASLFAFNGHGGFSDDHREYVMTVSADHMTPAPWTNVIANAEFGTLVSESGSACTWSENAHELRLTTWSNDPVTDPCTEAFYIRDEATGRFWSPTLQPTRSASPYVVRHGFGYSSFAHSENGIASELRIHVAIDAAVKFSSLTLRNTTNAPRQLTVTGYVEWVLGDERAKTMMQIVTSIDDATGALFATNPYNTDFAGRTAFFDVEGSGRSNCADRGDFFGVGGSLAAPRALTDASGELSGRVGAALDPCAALRVAVDIPAGETRTIVFRLGAGKTGDDARALVRRWRADDAATASLDAVHAWWRETLGVVQVRTPVPSLDALANGWLLYQVIASRFWGRTAFYQTSGAFGFRDQLQDAMALVHARPELLREHLLRSASRQFLEGDVQHWWHPPTGKGVRTRCSDDYLWLAFATSRYVDVTGDVAVLDETVPFLDSRPLKDGEASNYELPKVSDQTASLYEHCQRAIRHGLRYGAHGLPLMGMGDWNDGMNLVGAQGRGESVWLAFFLISVLKRFAPVARGRGDAAFAALCESEAEGLRTRTEASAWDGDWYQRAWFDDGSPLGTKANAECRIDSIAQSWSVLSGAASTERGHAAMESLHRRLVHTDSRLVQLLDPPFDTSTPSPGYIQGYVPGVRENGGQYTHAAMWATMAFAEIGDADRAWELFGLLDPVRHGASADDVATYKVEPYVIAGDVYAFAPHTGRGGWTWYTGSAGWMVQLIVESLLGLRRAGNQLRLRPLLPRDWNGFAMRYRFGGSTYDITCRRTDAAATRLSVDGTESADGTITLQDDEATHVVVLEVGRERVPAPA